MSWSPKPSAIIVAGDGTWTTWVRVVVNYATPFVVTSVGFLAGCRIRTETDDGHEGRA